MSTMLMNLKPITPPLRPEQVVRCVQCGQLIGHKDEGYADLNGRPFVDYYHGKCVKKDLYRW